jgi:uncharacterized OB-fold protein
MTNAEQPQRPLPRPRPIDREYWEGCLKGELRLQHCGSCGTWRFPPEPICPKCLSTDYRWEPASGRGTVWSWIIMHRDYFPGLKDQLPYNVALIRLDEGPMLISNVDCPRDRISCDMPVAVFFERISDDYALPRFRPATSEVIGNS